MIFLGAFFGSFVSVFLKGIQAKNVQHNLYRATFGTSLALGLVDAVTVNLIVRGGWLVGTVTGLGAGLGMCLAMFVHPRVSRG